MKKILVFLFALIFSIRCLAQAEFGLFAGPHATSVKYTIKNVKQPAEFKFGFHAGVGWKVFFDNHLYFSPGISYSLMGYKVKFNRSAFPPDLLAKNNNTSFHEVDLDFLLQYDLGKDPNHFFIKLGPAVNFVITGKEEYDLNTGAHVSHAMVFSFGDYGRYLASGVVDFGYETSSGYSIYVHYVHGLGSMNNADDGPAIRNRLIGITFGKFLNPKKFE